MMCLDMSRIANPIKNGFSTLRTGVFNLMPIRFSEYMVVPAIMSYPCFWMMGFTFITCASKLHLYSLQSSLHEFSIGGVCLIICTGSFLRWFFFPLSNIDVLKDEGCLFETDDAVGDVRDVINPC